MMTNKEFVENCFMVKELINEASRYEQDLSYDEFDELFEINKNRFLPTLYNNIDITYKNFLYNMMLVLMSMKDGHRSVSRTIGSNQNNLPPDFYPVAI